MKLWMIPWLLPLGIIVMLLAVALLPGWAAGALGAVALFICAPLALKPYFADRPDRQLPTWLPGGRPPR